MSSHWCLLIDKDNIPSLKRKCNDTDEIFFIGCCGSYQSSSFKAVKPMIKILLIQHFCLTHWGWVMHLCIRKLTSIASDNGLSPRRRQAIIWNNAEILLIGPLGTIFSEIFIGIQTFSLKKIYLKMSSAKCRTICLNLNVLIYESLSWIAGHLYRETSSQMASLYGESVIGTLVFTLWT